jgi:hypothetical protein
VTAQGGFEEVAHLARYRGLGLRRGVRRNAANGDTYSNGRAVAGGRPGHARPAAGSLSGLGSDRARSPLG